jgi:hypothetical protein
MIMSIMMKMNKITTTSLVNNPIMHPISPAFALVVAPNSHFTQQDRFGTTQIYLVRSCRGYWRHGRCMCGRTISKNQTNHWTWTRSCHYHPLPFTCRHSKDEVTDDILDHLKNFGHTLSIIGGPTESVYDTNHTETSARDCSGKDLIFLVIQKYLMLFNRTIVCFVNSPRDYSSIKI